MELYWAFAENFPEHSKQWNKLAEEEKNHAFIIRGLAHALESEELKKSFFNVHISEIESAIAEIKKMITAAHGHSLTSAEAVKAAAGIERGLLESSVFTVFKTNDQKMTEVIKKLTQDTKSHFEQLGSFKFS